MPLSAPSRSYSATSSTSVVLPVALSPLMMVRLRRIVILYFTRLLESTISYCPHTAVPSLIHGYRKNPLAPLASLPPNTRMPRPLLPPRCCACRRFSLCTASRSRCGRTGYMLVCGRDRCNDEAAPIFREGGAVKCQAGRPHGGCDMECTSLSTASSSLPQSQSLP